MQNSRRADGGVVEHNGGDAHAAPLSARIRRFGSFASPPHSFVHIIAFSLVHRDLIVRANNELFVQRRRRNAFSLDRRRVSVACRCCALFASRRRSSMPLPPFNRSARLPQWLISTLSVRQANNSLSLSLSLSLSRRAAFFNRNQNSNRTLRRYCASI